MWKSINTYIDIDTGEILNINKKISKTMKQDLSKKEQSKNLNQNESSKEYTRQENQDKQKSNGKETYIQSYDGTPFSIVTINDKIYIAIGNECIKMTESVEEAKLCIKNRDWDLIMSGTFIYAKFINENINNKKN